MNISVLCGFKQAFGTSDQSLPFYNHFSWTLTFFLSFTYALFNFSTFALFHQLYFCVTLRFPAELWLSVTAMKSQCSSLCVIHFDHCQRWRRDDRSGVGQVRRGTGEYGKRNNEGTWRGMVEGAVKPEDKVNSKFTAMWVQCYLQDC